jgi:hypothetical protein
MAIRDYLDNLGNNSSRGGGGNSSRRSGLNRSSFLRPRKGRSITTVQKPAPRPSPPPRQEILPPRTDEVESYDDSQREVSPQASMAPAPLEITQQVSPVITNPIENNFTAGAPSSIAVSVDPSNPYLKFVRNPYPSELGENPMGNYSRKNGSVEFKGKYEENVLTFKEWPLNGITSIEGTSFNFIIQFADGTKYTSPGFLQELELEFSVGNPYRTVNTIATVTVDDTLLSGYATFNKFKLGENYAEMNVSNNIDTKEEIIAHIDWLVGSGVELRDATEMGAFTSNPTEDLGFAFQPEIDGEDPKPKENEESTIGVDIGETVDPVVTSDTPTTPPVVDDVFPPFGVPGMRPNELRTYAGNGKRYRWDSARRGIFGRRGTDRGTWICIGDTAPTQSTTTSAIIPKFTLPNRGFGGITMGNFPSGNSYSGGKIICGELYRQGFLSEEVWEADQRFGKELFKTNPRISLGYVFWAREVVKYMKNNPNHTKYLYRICKPWTEHMAYKMGISKKRNIVGNITQKIGYVYSLIVYNYYQLKWGRNRLTI